MKRTFSLFLFTLFIYSLSASAQYRRIYTLAGKGGTGAYSGDGYTATNAFFNGPEAVSIDKAGNVYIVDYYNLRVRKVFKATGQVVNFAGNGIGGYAGDGSAATSAEIDPQGVAADMRGNVFISDANFGVIRKVNPLGIISTYAGGHGYGYTGDGGPASAAKLAAPSGLFTDAKSNLYVCDAGNHVIRKIDTFGVISTVAGNGIPGYFGDNDSVAVSAEIDSPYAVAVDRYNNMYIADHNNNVIRKVDGTTGIITTIAGVAGSYGYLGDNGPATAATFNGIRGVVVDTQLNVYISDAGNNVIRKIDTNGVITTTVGNSYPGFGGDLGDPLGANLFNPYGIALDTFGSLYIADANNQRVRKVYYTNLGVHDVYTNNGISVYPNPFENEVCVAGLGVNDKVCVYDLAGRKVSTTWTVTHSGLQTYTISGLPEGVYALQVADSEGNKKATIRLVK